MAQPILNIKEAISVSTLVSAYFDFLTDYIINFVTLPLNMSEFEYPGCPRPS